MNIIVVDEKDNVIGTKKEEDLKQSDIYRVTALWVTNNKGEILLTKRSKNKKHHPSKWGPAVAGTVEKDESYNENIIKEAEEELGIKNPKFNRGPKTRNSGKYNHFPQWYDVVINKKASEFIIQKEEVEEVKWFDVVELKRLLEEKPKDFLPKLKTSLDLFS